jgi:hemerythrin
MLRSERDALKTGIPIIDKQHDEYADLVDSFFKMAEQGNVSRAALALEMNKVLKYAIEHFDTEEQFMRSLNYPHYEEHYTKHNIFRDRTDSCCVEIESACDIDVCAITMSKWLINWFCDQVQTDDMKLAEFVKSQNWVI